MNDMTEKGNLELLFNRIRERLTANPSNIGKYQLGCDCIDAMRSLQSERDTLKAENERLRDLPTRP